MESLAVLKDTQYSPGGGIMAHLMDRTLTYLNFSVLCRDVVAEADSTVDGGHIDINANEVWRCCLLGTKGVK